MNQTRFCLCCASGRDYGPRTAGALSRRHFLTTALAAASGVGLLPGLARAQESDEATDGAASDASTDGGATDGQTAAQTATLGRLHFPEPAIAVTTFVDPVSYDFSQSLSDLREIARTGDQRNIQDGAQPVGLAMGALVIRFSGSNQITRLPDGVFYSAVAQAKFDLGIEQNTIYVAHELPRNSCPHREVLAHEETHKEIDRQLLEDFQPQAESFFGSVVREIGIIRTASAEDANQMISRYFKHALDSFGALIHDERMRRQQAFDSPREYARLGNSCEGLLQEIVNTHAQR